MDVSAPPTIIQRRIAIGALICVMAFAVIGFRLVDIMVLKGGGVAPRGGAAYPLTTRADLLDRNGELLARDLPVHDVYAQPRFLVHKQRAARELAAATGAGVQRLTRIFASHHRYVLVERKISPDAQARVMDLGLPGIEFQPSYKRYYPKGGSAQLVIGYTDGNGHGISGLELGLNKLLEGGIPGKDGVRLSLDMRVQYALAQEIEAAREEFTARAAGGIVINVDTGEVLAMVSLPDGAPGIPNYGANPVRNRMADSDYELGSVFKIFSFAMALSEHTITPDTEFPIPRAYKIGRFYIHDADPMPPVMTAREILARSSNVGTSQIVLRSGGVKQKAFLAKLGLLTPVRSQLPEGARPIYPSDWGDIETATIGFGQGISITPLSYVHAAAEVVNGGRALQLTFLRHPEDARGKQLIPRSVSLEMRALLRNVVVNGTGKSANIPGYDVGGKTGSAQVAGPDGRYLHGPLRTSFCAIFPADHPRYLLFVLLDQPHGTKKTFGLTLSNFTAAPLAGHVIARIAPLLGLVPQLPLTTDAGVQTAAKDAQEIP
ncbi:MAG: penicillin-binding protein 2 [Alphaproteobacteria bacterium]|nr:penicillin-binding protein 2 [Alphaproteobacteria bacterium]